jgi:hypothetical protein
VSKIQDRLSRLARDCALWSEYEEYDMACIGEAADALDAAERALGGAWYFIAAFDKDNAPNVLAEIKAALAKLEGAK